MKKYFALILILLLAAALRFYHNLDISIWHDEAFSALMIRYPWAEMFYRLGLDVHPPAYYVGLRLWHYAFGDTVLSLRGFSVFFGVGTVWAGWLFVKETFKNEKAAIWTALLLAINPFALKFASEARMYTFGAFFALLSGYFLIKALNFQQKFYDFKTQNMPNLPDAKKNKRFMFLSYLAFAICVAVSVYTHYYLFFTAAAFGIYGLGYLFFHTKGGIKRYLAFLSSCLLAALAFIPWLKIFLFQLAQVNAGYWIDKMNIWSIPSTFWDMLLGFARDVHNPQTQVWLVISLAFSLLMLFTFLKKTESPHKWLVALCVVMPFLGSLSFALLAKIKGSSSSVYLDRYFLFASLYYTIALSVWLKEIKLKPLSQSLFAILIILNLVAFSHYWKSLDIKSKPGMQGAAKFLKANAGPGQAIFVGTAFEFFNYKYYNQTNFETPERPKLFTGGRDKASQMSHVEGVAMLADEDLAPNFTDGIKRGDTVWLIWTYAFGSNKPELPLNWVQIDEKQYPDVRPYTGATIFVSEFKVN